MKFFATPDEAEAAFYAAFSSGDLEAMMLVWADSANSSCIHPMSSPIQGHTAIRSSWQSILQSGGARLSWQTLARHAGSDLAVHRVEESLSLPQGVKARMHATHVYLRQPDAGWKLLIHHASPLPQTRAPDPAYTMH